jgi:CheY-like chemotaxis protein
MQVEIAENGRDRRRPIRRVRRDITTRSDGRADAGHGRERRHAAIRALPRADAAVPIIAMTANAYEEDVEASRAAG